jgi:N-acetylmuramoyl-L-alanine amidase
MYKICIDPGHGGTDRANRGPTGYIEADGVLAISKYLRDELVATGQFNVMLTRETDATVSLTERGKKAGAWGADLFISQHTNATGLGLGQTKVSGTEVFYSVNRTSDNVIASAVSKAIANVLQVPNKGAKTRESTKNPGRDYYTVIDSAQTNGVRYILLVESAFHDNPSDEAKLKDIEYQKKVAWAQASVICNLFKVRNTLGVHSANEYAIRDLQGKLNKIGYNVSVDGMYGNQCISAIRDLQSKNNLTVTGAVDYTTWGLVDKLALNVLPTPVSVSISSPEDNSTFTLGQTIEISVKGVNCYHVAIFMNGVYKEKAEGNNLLHKFTPTEAGSYTLKAAGRNGPESAVNSTKVESKEITINVVKKTAGETLESFIKKIIWR